MTELEAAYQTCQDITRREASSFYYGMRLLPPPKRRALMAVYAWCRLCDDAVDDQEGAAAESALAQLRGRLDRIYRGTVEPAADPVDVALADTVTHYELPVEPFLELLEGMETDLHWPGMPNFGALRLYCERVAGTVGRLAVEIFGYRDAAAPQLAVDLGVALQLTNILRDVSEDADRGRVYLPEDAMAAWGVAAGDILAHRATPGLRRLLGDLAARARECFTHAEALYPLVDADARRCPLALARIYQALLTRIETAQFDVVSHRLSVPGWQKLWVVSRLWL